MATIRERVGRCTYESNDDSVPRESAPVPRGRAGVIQYQGVAIAVARQSRTGFAFGASAEMGDGVSEWPEKKGLLNVSDGENGLAWMSVEFAFLT